MDQSETPDPTVRRRSVLLGGAAAAAVAGVAAVAGPAGATAARPSTAQSAASPQALTGAGLVNAVDVDLVPAGELTATNVQDALYDLDGRLSKMRPIEELHAIPARLGAMTLIDDFMGNTSTSGAIGSLGWAIGSSTTGTVGPKIVAGAPGVVELGTGGVANGWMGINLGSQSMFNCPAFVQETRAKLDVLNAGTETASVIFGLTGPNLDAGTFEPKLGCYFRYGPPNSTYLTSNWHVVCAIGGGRKAVDTGIPGDLSWHRFRITSLGPTAPGPGVRFTIDDVQVPPSWVTTQNLPSGYVGYSPTIDVRKLSGSVPQTIKVDYYALRWTVAR